MQRIVDFVNSAISNYYIDSYAIQSLRASLGKLMKIDDWISIILSNRECVVLKFNNGVFMNEGFVINDEKVLKVLGNHQFGDISYSEQSTEVVEGIVDLNNGSRFEGLVLTDGKEGKIGIPFGYGEMYDDDGLLIYKGIMINWKRFGYGTSYHDNGLKEYEGYWCDDNRFGSGKVYDRKGWFMKECLWYYGIESNIEEYCGDGSETLSIEISHMKLTDNCVLVDWDISLLSNLESIEIGNKCFESVQTFQIDGLNRLKTIKIGNNSFTQVKWNDFNNDWDGSVSKCRNESKSFHILNCESLKVIEIGYYSFADFGGEFELRDLDNLESIIIGEIEYESMNFIWCSFKIRGKNVK